MHLGHRSLAWAGVAAIVGLAAAASYCAPREPKGAKRAAGASA